MSLVTFSFNIAALPISYQSAFLTRLFQLNLEYQVLTAPVPPSPPAESLPMPDFAPVEGDEPAPVKKARKNPWADLTEEQRAERLAKLAAGRAAKKTRKMSEDSLAAPVAVAAPVGDKYDQMSAQQLRDDLADRKGVPPTPEGAKPTGPRRHSGKFSTVELLRTELRRLDALAAAPAPVVADTASETSSKKPRKNPWADLTPEQKAERVAKMQATRKAYLAGVAAAEAANEARLREEVAAEVAAEAAAAAPAAASDTASETSSKKTRKSGWANYTPEQREARIAKMKASRQRTMANLADISRLHAVFGLPASASTDGSA